MCKILRGFSRLCLQTSRVTLIKQNKEVHTTPNHHLFSRDFNFANFFYRNISRDLDDLKFCDFDESPFFEVIKFRESSTQLVLVF